MIDVVIANWNSGDLLARCLASLEAAANGAVTTVVVVDNASSDCSAAHATNFTAKSFDYRSVVNQSNEGFAAACNKGAAYGKAEFILFLNPDCELFSDTVQQLVGEVRQLAGSDHAVFGIPLVDREGEIARTCARQPTPADFWIKILGLDRLSGGRIRSHIMTEWSHTESRDVEHVIGAFYLVRRRVFEALGGFDERFFVYLEDLDLSRRILKAGYRIRYLSGAGALHVGGGSSSQIKARRLYYSLRSRILFAFKHFSVLGAWVLLAGTILLEPVIRLGYGFARLDFREVGETLNGYQILWSDLPRLLASRDLA